MDEGSKVPVLERRLPEGELAIPDEYDDARDLVSEAIEAVSAGHPLPTGFPATVLPKFSRLGLSLAGEYREFWDVLHDAQGSPPETSRRVRIDAETEYDAGGVAQRFLVVHDVTMLDTWEWAESRLAELGAIEHGWFDGEHGEPVDEAAFDAAGALLEGLAEAEAPPPHLFPTPEGGIQAQWRDDAVTVSVEFEPGGRTSLHALNVESGEDQYVELESADIDRAVRFVIDTTRAAS